MPLDIGQTLKKYEPLDIGSELQKYEPLDTKQESVPLDIGQALQDLGEAKPIEPKPGLIERGVGAAKIGAEAIGTLALSGAAWMAGLGVKYAPYKLDSKSEDIDEQIAGGDVLVGPGAIITKGDIARKEEIRKERKHISEQIQELPSIGTSDTSQKIVGVVAIPFEKVGVARKFYQDMATEKWGEATGDLIGDAFEVTAFIGLPKLASKLRANVKSGKIEAAKKTVREIHRAQLAQLIREPNRLEHLARVERNLKTGEYKEPVKPQTTGELKQSIVAEQKVNDAASAELNKAIEDAPEFISGAAVMDTDGGVHVGKTHHLALQALDDSGKTYQRGSGDLFVTNKKRILRRQEAEKLTNEPSGDAVDIVGSSIETSGGTTLSMLGTQNAYDLIVKQKDFLNKLHDTISVEAPWERRGKPDTGLAFKNIMSRRSVMEEMSAREVAVNAKLFNYDNNVAPDVVLASENPKLRNKTINPAVDHVLDFQESIRKEYARRGVKLDFKGRIRNEILELIDTAESVEDIAALRGALKDIESINFVHIPANFWFQEFLGKDPAGGSRLLKLVATQKRKSFSIQSLLDRGLITREQLHPGDIIASYGRRAGKDFALLDLRDAAVKDGLAYHGKNKKAPEGFVDGPSGDNIFKDYKLDPAFSDALDAMMRYGEGRSFFDKTIALTKMTAFYNPLFLPMYDGVQATMLGSTLTPRMPVEFVKGMRDSFSRNANWQEAGRWGLFSKPFNNPLQSYIDMVNWAKKSPRQKFFRMMESVYPKNWLKSAYTPGWTVAWKLDEGIRMMSYNYLRRDGMSPRQAAQTAALFHGDYASVPAATRKKLNRIFFTPTFKIAMGKLYARMMKDAIKSAVKLGRTDKVTNRFAKGALYTAGLTIAFDQFMVNGLGYKRDEIGRRYVKDVIDENGEHRQEVFTLSTPFNMWQKYYYRVKNATKSGVPSSARKLLEYNRWEFHPLWRTAYDVLITNDNGLGDKIHSEFDDVPVKIYKDLKYSFKNIVRIAGVLDQEPSTKEAQELFAKENGRALELITRPFAFKYMRSEEDLRASWKMKKLAERFSAEASKAARSGSKMSDNQYNNFSKQLDDIMAERDKKK